MNNIYPDAGTAGTWLYDKRQVVAQLLKGSILGVTVQGSASWRRHAGTLEDLLGNQFIHGQGTAKGIRSCILDSKNIEGCLEFPVFSNRAVKPHECYVSNTA